MDLRKFSLEISAIQICNKVNKSFLTPTHLPDGIVGGVDDDGLRSGVEFTGELVWVQKPVGTRDCLLSRLLQYGSGHFYGS